MRPETAPGQGDNKHAKSDAKIRPQSLKLVLVQIVIANKSLGSAEQEPDQFLFLNDRMRIGPHELSPFQGETLSLDVPQG
jgi:hypothetical protein